MDFYYPGRKFPSMSVTGGRCALDCPHCRGRYLDDMEDVDGPDELYEYALRLEDRGANGFLLSGGCDERGKVPLYDFISCTRRIKEETDLLINVHTGLPDDDLLEGLSDSPIDIISYEMIGSKDTIGLIYGIDASPSDYKLGYDRLKENGMKVVPHITVGLHKGRLRGEFQAVDMIDDTDRIVLNSLIPSDFGRRVDEGDFLSVVEYCRNNLDSEVVMGCMRERGRSDMEIEALKRGLSGIVVPSNETREWAVERFEIERKELCCAFVQR